MGESVKTIMGERRVVKPEPGMERAITHALIAWAGYADEFRVTHGMSIGRDHVFGPAWDQMGRSIVTFLSGYMGKMERAPLVTRMLTVAQKNDSPGEALAFYKRLLGRKS